MGSAGCKAVGIWRSKSVNQEVDEEKLCYLDLKEASFRNSGKAVGIWRCRCMQWVSGGEGGKAGDGVKLGLWTLDRTMDWTMDWNMDSILDSFSSF